MLDIETVMTAAGSEQAALLGMSEGGPMAILFARRLGMFSPGRRQVFAARR